MANGVKGAQTNKERYGDDHFKKIGSQSWKNPNRSRLTGFALMKAKGQLDKLKQASAKGGQNKKGYRKNATQDSPSVQNTDETDRIQEEDFLDEAFLIFEDEEPTDSTKAQENGPGPR